MTLTPDNSEHQATVDIENLSRALKIAEKYSLECEVLCWAMYALQGNSKLSIGQAMNIGLDEWIK